MSYVCLVTGASRGIGLGAALSLAKRPGPKVTIVMNYARNDAAAAKACAEVTEAAGGRPPIMIKADLSKDDECQRLICETVAKAGRLDAIILNHGILVHEQDVGDSDLSFANYMSKVREQMSTNYESCAALSFLAVRQFLAQNADKKNERFCAKLEGVETSAAIGGTNGRIVSITSRASVRGELTEISYAASKSALSIHAQSLARRFAADGIYSAVIAPGWVRTEMADPILNGPGGKDVLAQHPLGRVAEVSELGETISWCACDAPLATTGTVIHVNGASYTSL